VTEVVGHSFDRDAALEPVRCAEVLEGVHPVVRTDPWAPACNAGFQMKALT
jgi:hypothetical protein